MIDVALQGLCVEREGRAGLRGLADSGARRASYCQRRRGHGHAQEVRKALDTELIISRRAAARKAQQGAEWPSWAEDGVVELGQMPIRPKVISNERAEEQEKHRRRNGQARAEGQLESQPAAAGARAK